MSARVYDLSVRWAWLLALAAAGVLLWWLGGRVDRPHAPPSSQADPLPDRAAFTGSAACRSCHDAEHAAWLSTAHARALGPPEAALGAFDGKAIGDTTPLRAGGGLAVNVDGRGGHLPGSHRVTAVVGGSTEQLYLFTDGRGAWRVLPIAWNVARSGWDRTHDVFGAITGEPVAGDVRQVVFNRDCGACHATRFDPGFRVEPNVGESYESTAVEPGVGCEACHGPGSVHARWHEEKRTGAYEAPARLMGGGAGACLRCHYAHEFLFAFPDEPVPFDDVAVSRNSDGFGFSADGRLTADRHAGTTFVQSACFRGGATCLSCHATHGDAKPSGDGLCTGCHDGFARREHTFHDEVGCLDCHMPRLLGAPLDRLRDHSLRSPEPALTEKFGVPNACNACHRDHDAAWASTWKEKWYGAPHERALRDAALVADLREGDVSEERVAEVARDPRSPLFFRATALRALPRGNPAVRESLGAAEVDLVQIACEALAERPDPRAAEALAGLLDHRARTVRIEAAYALARGGWHAEQPWPQIRNDARALLGRQVPTVPLLLRAAWIHEAFGGPEEMAFLLPEIARRSPADAAPLMQRRGRDLAQVGRHDEARLAYEDAARAFGDTGPLLLLIDSADSAAAGGGTAEAVPMWRHVVEQAQAESVEHAIARARLLGVEGQGEEGAALLEPWAAKLGADPFGAELLLRVRWSLDVLGRAAAGR